MVRAAAGTVSRAELQDLPMGGFESGSFGQRVFKEQEERRIPAGESGAAGNGGQVDPPRDGGGSKGRGGGDRGAFGDPDAGFDRRRRGRRGLRKRTNGKFGFRRESRGRGDFGSRLDRSIPRLRGIASDPGRRRIFASQE
jgi:hypothetical protein